MNQNTEILIAVAIGIGAISFGVGMSAHRKLAAIQRSLAKLQGSAKGKTILDAVATYGSDVKLFEEALNKLLSRQDDLAATVSSAVRNVAIVRYDAFEDQGGRLSFSAALVDDHGTGMVLSTISGRTEARTYAKMVEEGESEMGLSPEEQKAIAEAMSGRKRTRTKVKAARR